MNSLDKVIDYILALPEVKRIHELENYIDNNQRINSIFNKLKQLQVQMVNSKEYNQINQYKNQLDEYNKLKEELFDLPFVEEYLELLNIVDNILLDMTGYIEDNLDKRINKKDN
ncbi:MAG: YlbF family regulator [Anaeroplasma sp.]